MNRFVLRLQFQTIHSEGCYLPVILQKILLVSCGVAERLRKPQLVAYMIIGGILLIPQHAFAQNNSILETMKRESTLVLLDDGVIEDNFDEDLDSYVDVYDPFEKFNRVSYTFNDKLYYWVLKPVKKVYQDVVPDDINLLIGNFFSNLRAPMRLVNSLLQGKFKKGGVVFTRFVLNSTIGVLGLEDVAEKEFELMPQRANFRMTLGVYGVWEGPYLYLPFFGPSNFRDSIGLTLDLTTYPLRYVDIQPSVNLIAFGADYVQKVSNKPDVYTEIKRISLDPYIAVREAYSGYQREAIKNS